MRTPRLTPILSFSFLLAGLGSLVLQFSPTAAVAGPVDSGPPAICLVTRPPNPPFVPPSPYPAKFGPDGFWFGTQKLWTWLPINGEWRGLRSYEPGGLSYRQKLFWFRQGYNSRTETQPALVVTGRQLDASEPPLKSDTSNGFTSYSFMVVGIDIPTLGCWEITGEYKGDKLSYVIWVAP